MIYATYKIYSGEVICLSDQPQIITDGMAQLEIEKKEYAWPLYCDGAAVTTASPQQISDFPVKEAEEDFKKSIESIQDGKRPELVAIIEAVAEAFKIDQAELLQTYIDKLNAKLQ